MKQGRPRRPRSAGRRLKVWWPADEAWYAGASRRHDGERHAIQYDDGDEGPVDLSKEKSEVPREANARPDGSQARRRSARRPVVRTDGRRASATNRAAERPEGVAKTLADDRGARDDASASPRRRRRRTRSSTRATTTTSRSRRSGASSPMTTRTRPCAACVKASPSSVPRVLGQKRNEAGHADALRRAGLPRGRNSKRSLCSRSPPTSGESYEPAMELTDH